MPLTLGLRVKNIPGNAKCCVPAGSPAVDEGQLRFVIYTDILYFEVKGD